MFGLQGNWTMMNCAGTLLVKIWSPDLDGQGSWWKSYSEPNALLVHCGPRMGPSLFKLQVHWEGAMSALRIQFTPW